VQKKLSVSDGFAPINLH